MSAAGSASTRRRRPRRATQVRRRRKRRHGSRRIADRRPSAPTPTRVPADVQRSGGRQWGSSAGAAATPRDRGSSGRRGRSTRGVAASGGARGAGDLAATAAARAHSGREASVAETAGHVLRELVRAWTQVVEAGLADEICQRLPLRRRPRRAGCCSAPPTAPRATSTISRAVTTSPIEFGPRRPWDHPIKRVGSPDKARAELDFEVATDLREGLRRTLEWMCDHLELTDRCVARHANLMRAAGASVDELVAV